MAIKWSLFIPTGERSAGFRYTGASHDLRQSPGKGRFEDHVAVPFETTVLGEAVTVEAIEQRGDTRIVAICKRGRSRQAIDILELPLPSPPLTGAEWIEAYRHWRNGW